MRKTISIADFVVGGDTFAVMAGPCAVETKEQLFASADAVAAGGAALLRGGAYKPRTSPKSFQGLGKAGLELLSLASQRTGLPVVTEVLDPRDVAAVAEHAAVLQIGARNMQNFPLLREVGRQRLPVLLKRGPAATVEELLYAAQYVTNEGNGNVILCERGIRSFDPSTRYVLDLAIVPVLRERTDLPIVVDPSHGTGRSSLVRPMVLAAAAAGADGVIVEVHADPGKALCDGAQALLPTDFAQMMVDLRRLLPMLGRRLSRPSAAGHATPAQGTISDDFIAP